MRFLPVVTAATVYILGSAVHGGTLPDNPATTLSRFLHDGPPPSPFEAQWASAQSSKAPANPATPPPGDSMTCWKNDCFGIVYNLNVAYVAGGKLVEPSPGDGSKERFQSTIFQKELCVDRKYNESVIPIPMHGLH